MALDTSRIVTAADVKWSDNSLFNGFLLLLLASPTLSGNTYERFWLQDKQRLAIPARVKIPILDGELQGRANEVWQSGSISPPGNKYCALWFDDQANQIATGPSLFTITTDEHTVTPPTLTIPTAAASCPDVALLTTTGVLQASFFPVLENLSGTKNGVNQTFTSTNTPRFVLAVRVNGVDQQDGNGYTQSGNTFTITPAPNSADALEVVYWR